MSNDFDNIIIMKDERGKNIRFEFLDLIEYNDEEYVVLIPCDEPKDEGEVVILKVDDVSDEDEEIYTSVDDEDTLNTVFEIFKEKYKDEFNFID